MINEHSHDSSHECAHDHSERVEILLYFLGVILYIVGLFVSANQVLLGKLLFSFAIASAGYHVIGEGTEKTLHNTIKAKRFMPNVHFLMVLATAGALIIGNFEEGALLILIFAGAHFLEEYVDGKSKREITNLLNLNPTEARLVKNDGSIKTVPVDQVVIGDTLKVLNGDQIPTDGIIIEGTTAVDESSINGESIPKEKKVGDEVYGSTMNGSGSFLLQVTKNSSETVFAKILEIVNQSQSDLTRTATLIERLEPKYVTTVICLFPIVLLAGPYVFGWTWELSFYRSLVYLISVSPCALAASAVPTTLSTISNLSKKGVLVKGGTFLSKLAEVKAISFDKTGTLTYGKPEVTDYVFDQALNQEKLLDIIVSMEKQANHPLAVAIMQKFPHRESLTLVVENQVGQGLTTIYQNHTYRIGKPSSFKIVSDAYKELTEKLSSSGKTVVFVSKDETVIGVLALMDLAQTDAKPAIDYFKQAGIHTTMITGDALETGKAVGQQLGINEVIANVMPEDKAAIVRKQQTDFGTTAMLGDGINDTPALVTADIGIAMGDGTDIAMDMADIVLMKNDLSKLVYAHQLAKKMNRVTWQNIGFALFVVIVLVTLNFLGKMDIALGVILHEFSTIAVILNGIRLLRTPKFFFTR